MWPKQGYYLELNVEREPIMDQVGNNVYFADKYITWEYLDFFNFTNKSYEF